jgi:L-2,4-diaminobutyric acid acetyltransferase
VQPRDRVPGANTTGRDVRFRRPTPSDGQALWQLARLVGLDLNSPYAYVLWGDRFSGTSVVAHEVRGDGGTDVDNGVGGDGAGRDEGDGVPADIVGYVTAFHPPGAPDTLFVWQVGVSPAARGRGLASRMLDELLARTGARWLEATVTPSNEASTALFTGAARRHDTDLDRSVAYPEDMFPGGHEAEILFRIGPLGPVAGGVRAAVDGTQGAHDRNPRM